MAKANLNQCVCGKTYNRNEYGTTKDYCCTCNEKRLSDFRKKDSLRKREARENKPSSDLEHLADFVED